MDVIPVSLGGAYGRRVGSFTLAIELMGEVLSVEATHHRFGNEEADIPELEKTAHTTLFGVSGAIGLELALSPKLSLGTRGAYSRTRSKTLAYPTEPAVETRIDLSGFYAYVYMSITPWVARN